MSEQVESKGGFLNWIERVGNKLPDPALIFLIALLITWVASAIMSSQGVEFSVQTKDGVSTETIHNQLSGSALALFLQNMVSTFAGFPPLGVVLVALLGVGVAEQSGFINAVLKKLLIWTPQKLLSPMLLLVAIVSHTAADAGYVLVIPLGGVIFYAAGRHPIAGIVCAFAGVSGGFSANFIPSGIDPLLQGFTQSAAQIQDPTALVNPLCNLGFTAASSVLIVLVGWYLTDRVIEPRLKSVKIDGNPEDMPKMEAMSAAENRGLIAGVVCMLLGVALLVVLAVPEDSALRSSTVYKTESGSAAVPAGGASLPGLGSDGADLALPEGRLSYTVTTGEVAAEGGSLTKFGSPIMKSIVPLIFLLFLIPGVVHGYVSGRFKNHRDVIAGMSKTMGTMSYYMVMAFFASLFIYAFNHSNLGKYLAVKGAETLQALGMPGSATVVGIIFLCAFVNLLVGSASAKWALLSPIFVPMLMQVGISPEMTQAAYRVGDSSTNIVTPLMPYFPLVVAFSQRYVKNAGVGTLVSLMLPYSLCFLGLWTVFLLAYWSLGIPLGFGA